MLAYPPEFLCPTCQWRNLDGKSWFAISSSKKVMVVAMNMILEILGLIEYNWKRFLLQSQNKRFQSVLMVKKHVHLKMLVELGVTKNFYRLLKIPNTKSIKKWRSGWVENLILTHSILKQCTLKTLNSTLNKYQSEISFWNFQSCWFEPSTVRGMTGYSNAVKLLVFFKG